MKVEWTPTKERMLDGEEDTGARLNILRIKGGRRIRLRTKVAEIKTKMG